MFQTEYFGIVEIQALELILAPFILLFIYFISLIIKNRKIESNPHYKYYIPGLFVKIFGGLMFCVIYIYYYKGGDTTQYYESACALVNLLLKNPWSFITVYFGSNSLENLFLFDYETGLPLSYMYFDPQTFMVIKLITPLLLLTLKSYILSTILLAWISYFGIWKMYLVFCRYYKELSGQLAIAVLFIPSVIFWGSGISKDTITFSAACWLIYSIYMALILKKNIIKYLILMIVSAIVVISIKPYIFIALVPGTLFWVFYEKIVNVKDKGILAFYLPAIYLLSLSIVIFIYSQIEMKTSKYSFERVLQTASVTQKDLKSESYSSNSFDIGEFDPTFLGVTSKAPLAINAGLFRPYIWESTNIVMIFSGLENLVVLSISVFLIFKLKLFTFLRALFENPFLFFCLSYSILFAFSVGLTTSNFGALVRFRIPFLPFFVACLFILNHLMNKNKALR
jgi:hypothetical protein